MHRSTLGTLTPSQLNISNRVSNVYSIGAPYSDAKSNSRRSSGIGKSLWKGDTRNLSDKAFLHRCQRKVEDFLMAHDFQVSAKGLTNPSVKEFQGIVSFLLQIMDANIRFSNKIEDDVIVNYKMMGYPFPISKGSLQSIGSPHSWPAVLAALAWMVELLMLDSEIEKQYGEFMEGDENFFLDYYLESYSMYLMGQDESLKGLQDQVISRIDNGLMEIDETLEELEKEIQQIGETLEIEMRQPSEVEVLQSQLESLMSDILKLDNHHKGLINATEEMGLEIEGLREELQETENDINYFNLEKEEIQSIVSNQVYNKKDVERMEEERERAKERLKRNEDQRTEKEKLKWKLEIEIEKSIESLESHANSFNLMAEKLKLIPETAKRAGGKEFKVHLNRTAKSYKEILGKSMKDEINPRLTDLNQEYVGKENELDSDRLFLEDEKDELLISVDVIKEEIGVMENQIRKVEENLRTERDRSELEIKALKKEILLLESSLDESAAMAVISLEEAQNHYAAKQKELEKLKSGLNLDAKNFNQDLHKAVTMIHDYKKHIQKKLKTMNITLDNRIKELTTMPLLMLNHHQAN